MPRGKKLEPGELSPREIEILQGYADQKTTKEVALSLDPPIAVKTVHNNLNSIYQKLGVVSITASVIEAIKLGLVKIDYGPERKKRFTV